MIRAFASSRKSSPNRTPVKKLASKNQSLLDPSRLRPPPITTSAAGLGSNNRLNITLGLGHQPAAAHHQTPINSDGDNEDEILSIAYTTTTGDGESSVV